MMIRKSMAAVAALLLAAAMPAWSQTAPAPRSGAQARSPCDSTDAADQARCLREQAEKMRGAAGSGSCDRLRGPDKERCLHEGGSASVSARGAPRR